MCAVFLLFSFSLCFLLFLFEALANSTLPFCGMHFLMANCHVCGYSVLNPFMVLDACASGDLSLCGEYLFLENSHVWCYSFSLSFYGFWRPVLVTTFRCASIHMLLANCRAVVLLNFFTLFLLHSCLPDDPVLDWSTSFQFIDTKQQSLAVLSKLAGTQS